MASFFCKQNKKYFFTLKNKALDGINKVFSKNPLDKFGFLTDTIISSRGTGGEKIKTILEEEGEKMRVKKERKNFPIVLNPNPIYWRNVFDRYSDKYDLVTVETMIWIFDKFLEKEKVCFWGFPKWTTQYCSFEVLTRPREILNGFFPGVSIGNCFVAEKHIPHEFFEVITNDIKQKIIIVMKENIT